MPRTSLTTTSQRRRLALLVGGLVGGLLAGLVATGCGTLGSTRQPRTVLVAAKVVPAYVTGADADRLQMFEARPVARDLMPDDPVTDVDQIRCRVAIAELPRGTVLSTTMFREPAELGVSLPPGIEGCT